MTRTSRLRVIGDWLAFTYHNGRHPPTGHHGHWHHDNNRHQRLLLFWDRNNLNCEDHTSTRFVEKGRRMPNPLLGPPSCEKVEITRCERTHPETVASEFLPTLFLAFGEISRTRNGHSSSINARSWSSRDVVACSLFADGLAQISSTE